MLFHIGDVTEMNEPLNYKQPCKNKYNSEWLKAMKNEMLSLLKNKTWSIIVDQRTRKSLDVNEFLNENLGYLE